MAAREESGRGGFTLRHSGQVALSEGWSGRVSAEASKGGSQYGFGDIRHISKGVFRLNLRDAWHLPEEKPKGLFRRCVEGGFRRDGFRAGFRDRWHFPKDGPEGGFDGDFEGLSAEASGRLRKAYRSASGTCVIYRKASKGLLGWLVPKGFSKEISKGGLPE